MTSITHTITADELLSMPEDGRRYELVRGELRTMPPAGYEHGNIAMNIGAALAVYVKAQRLGRVCAADTGFKLTSNPDTVRAPDVGFISQARFEAIGSTAGYWPGAPDLVVEVVSPNDLYHEVDEKITDWLNAGVTVVLVINPRQRTIRIYRSSAEHIVLTENDTLNVPDVIPGWSMSVREILS